MRTKFARVTARDRRCDIESGRSAGHVAGRADVDLSDHSPEEDGDGIGDGGIRSVCPACNFKGLSMRLNFCISLTLMLCIFAIEVSVSPRATMWLLPSPVFVEDSAAAGVDVDVDVDVEAEPSPIMTPGRWVDSCN